MSADFISETDKQMKRSGQKNMLRTVNVKEVTAAIKEMCIEANHFLSDDMAARMKKAVDEEESPLGKQILTQLQENLQIAGDDMIPICQDTGMAVVFIKLPIEMDRNVIYYMGPSPAREGRPIGSAGPTTASRMDKYAPNLIDLGLGAMIGKGKRSQAVIDAVVRNGCVYFAAVGGAGALLSKRILSSEVVAYDDLGTEAIRKLQVTDFPVIVVIDSEGNNLYETAIREYEKKFKNVVDKVILILYNRLCV